LVHTYENAIRLEAYFRSMELKFSSLLVCLQELKQTNNTTIYSVATFSLPDIPKSKFKNATISKYRSNIIREEGLTEVML